MSYYDLWMHALACRLRQESTSHRIKSLAVKHLTRVLLNPGMASPAPFNKRLGFLPRPFKASAATGCHPSRQASRTIMVSPSCSLLNSEVAKTAASMERPGWKPNLIPPVPFSTLEDRMTPPCKAAITFTLFSTFWKFNMTNSFASRISCGTACLYADLKKGPWKPKLA